MSRLHPLLERNRDFAATGAHSGLVMKPRQPVLVVTCLDPRVDPGAFLGLTLVDDRLGDPAAEAVIDDIAFVGTLARTMQPEGPLFEVAVIHHTDCGNRRLADASFRSIVAARTGRDDSTLADLAVVDPAVTVRADVQRLLSSPKTPPQISVSGYVYDLESGLVRMVADAAQPELREVSVSASATQ